MVGGGAYTVKGRVQCIYSAGEEKGVYTVMGEGQMYILCWLWKGHVYTLGVVEGFFF